MAASRRWTGNSAIYGYIASIMRSPNGILAVPEEVHESAARKTA